MSGSSASEFDLEIVRTTLIAYTEELAATLALSAPTFEISQAREFAVALADPRGGIVAIDNPQQLGSVAQAAGHLAEYFEFDLHEGDVVLANDPYAGGVRVQDLTLSTPLTVEDELLLHLVVRVRIRDMGGQVAGSLNPNATEIWAEGHPVTPIKIRRYGRPVRDLLAMFAINGRHQDETRQTLDSAIAALELGKRRVADLVGRYGVDVTRAALAHAQDYSEQVARSAIGAWADGTYEAERRLELEPEAGGPVDVRLTATVAEGRLVLDFTASDDQRPVFVNSTSGSTASCALSAALAALGDAIPANSGLLRVVEVRTRPGSVVHAIRPVPIGWGATHCGNEITDAVASALRGAVGDDALPALTTPRPLVLSRPADDRHDQTDLGRWGIGGAAAVADVDGWGPPQLAARARLPSIEQWEAEHAMSVECLEFVADSGGAGQWRGAPGVEATIAVGPDRRFTLWTATATAACGVEGLAGGAAAAGGAVELHEGDGWRPAPVRAGEAAIAADRVRLRLAGGGGFGDPSARDRAAVEADLADGLISVASARDVYKLDVEEIDDTMNDDA